MAGTRLHVRRAGSDGLLAEVADLDAALALAAALRLDPPHGVRELVPGARTVLVRFEPAATTPAALAADLAGRSLAGQVRAGGPLVEVPVCYDGADLDEVARVCGLDVGEVVRRHTGTDWWVAFTGFAPGFGYLAGGDPALDVPRRATARTAVPAGSVALAGRFSGVYPRASPGGWQLLGRTGLAVWDPGRAGPALLTPGTRVRFVDAGPAALAGGDPPWPAAPPRPAARGRALEVSEPGPLTVVVDLGRPDQAASGVARSGAVDRGALRRANRLVGNPAGAPALEVAGGGLVVRARGDLVVAVTGARVPLVRADATGPAAVGPDAALLLDDGAELRLGLPGSGRVAYLAVRGGVDAAVVLGSASADLLAGIGPPPLRAGDRLAVAGARESAVASGPEPGPTLPAPGALVEVDVLLGPRDDWFTPAAVTAFLAQEWTVTPRSNRVGLRLAGAADLARSRQDELPSEGMVPGAVQVPPGGEPVVLAADHPVTGGYPVIACVADHHLDRLAQVPVGGRIRFRAVG